MIENRDGQFLIFSILLIQLLISSSIFAQWSFSLATTQEYNSNPFRSVNPYSDFISTFDIGIQKEFEKLNILYYGSYNSFMESSDITYYWHQLGLYGGTDDIKWGAYFEQRINREANNYFDYQNFVGYLNKTFNFLNLRWSSNIFISAMNYTNLSDFNNWVLSANLTVSKGFETRTTLIGSLTYNYKGFKDYNSTEDTTVNYDLENVNVSQIVFNGRVAQSLFENTGLALNVNLKKILSGSGFGASLFESTYGEMELYDDPISQEGYSTGIMLTQVFPSEFIFRLRYYYFHKIYPSQGIYLSESEYNEDEIRIDDQSNISASLTKSFSLNSESGSAINLSLNFYLINNKSNSYYYDYESNYLSFGLGFQF